MWLAALGAGHLSPAGGATSCDSSSAGSHSASDAGSGSASSSSGISGSGGGGSGSSWCLGDVHVAAFAGIAALGVADAAASAIGLAVGRHRIFRGVAAPALRLCIWLPSRSNLKE